MALECRPAIIHDRSKYVGGIRVRAVSRCTGTLPLDAERNLLDIVVESYRDVVRQRRSGRDRVGDEWVARAVPGPEPSLCFREDLPRCHIAADNDGGVVWHIVASIDVAKQSRCSFGYRISLAERVLASPAFAPELLLDLQL